MRVASPTLGGMPKRRRQQKYPDLNRVSQPIPDSAYKKMPARWVGESERRKVSRARKPQSREGG
jgi:hypothetical protein